MKGLLGLRRIGGVCEMLRKVGGVEEEEEEDEQEKDVK